MIGNIIAAIVIGIIAGYLGRALLPGDDSMGFVATVVVGIVGALVGCFAVHLRCSGSATTTSSTSAASSARSSA